MAHAGVLSGEEPQKGYHNPKRLRVYPAHKGKVEKIGRGRAMRWKLAGT